jgi:UDP-N-acetylmuramate dehydrogenase
LSLYKRFQQNKRLSDLSTFGIGGPCRYFVEISTIQDMQEVVCHCTSEGLPFVVIGKGSNTLFDDKGFNGLVIQNKITLCEYREFQVYVGAGYSFALLGVQTARKGLAGLEFASGIPASVGGAIYMNAGANGSEIADCIQEVTFITKEGDVQVLTKQDLHFAYRTSCFHHKKGVIVAGLFALKEAPDAREKQLQIIDYRMRTQPYGEKSAGCVFANPVSEAAGALIQRCGLKGTVIGGAEVSPLHANFIVNKGHATAADVLSLAAHVQASVKEKTGVDLKMEIRTIPYDISS